MFADGKEAGGEAVAQCLAPGDAVGAGISFLDKIQGGEGERFVGAFVRRAFLDRGGARVEVVKPFDGRVQGHGGSLSGMESDGKQKRTENQMGLGETEDFETEDRRPEGLERASRGGKRWVSRVGGDW